jgi:large subunit ribosomal protein L25
MADIDDTVVLQERSVLGKGLHRVRNEGLVPGVIHNHGDPSIHVMAPEIEINKVYQAAGKHHPLNLKVGSEKYLVLIKAVQFNPVKHRMQHIVFQAIRQNEKVQAEVPIRLEGDIPAEKIGLMVLHQLDQVQIEALPKNLPDELFVSTEKLAELHDKITVADLRIPEGVTILTDAEHPIATVVETKAQISEEAEEAAGGEETEGQTPEGTDSETSSQQSQ